MVWQNGGIKWLDVALMWAVIYTSNRSCCSHRLPHTAVSISSLHSSLPCMRFIDLQSESSERLFHCGWIDPHRGSTPWIQMSELIWDLRRYQWICAPCSATRFKIFTGMNSTSKRLFYEQTAEKINMKRCFDEADKCMNLNRWVRKTTLALCGGWPMLPVCAIFNKGLLGINKFCAS